MKMKMLLQKIIYGSLLVFCCSLVVLARGDADDEMRWEDAENEVTTTRFPDSFIDSIYVANNIPDQSGLGTPVRLPFKRREKLVFDGGWGFIRAGFLILESYPDSVREDRFHFTGKVVTNNFVSAFYKVRDYIHSEVDYKSLYPYVFEQRVQEGKYQAQRWTVFDHVRGRVYDNKKKDGDFFEAGALTRDYVSLLFYMRTMELKPGQKFTIQCFVHGKDYPVKFKVVGREKVKVEAGEFRCLEIEPTLVGDGRGFTKKDKMTIWVTDDERHMPVMVKAKIALGSLSAKLLRYEYN